MVKINNLSSVFLESHRLLKKLLPFKKQTGFSIIELLVVVAVGGILCGIGVYNESFLIQRYKIDIIMKNLYRAVQLSKMEAIKLSTTITICGLSLENRCSTSWYHGCIIFADRNKNGKIDKNDAVIKKIVFAKSCGSLTWKSFPNKEFLQFKQNGFTNNQNGTFIFKSKKKQFIRKLIISKSGRGRME